MDKTVEEGVNRIEIECKFEDMNTFTSAYRNEKKKTWVKTILGIMYARNIFQETPSPLD